MVQLDTHEVINQPPPLDGYDVFGRDAALGEAVEREGAAMGPARAPRRSAALAGSEPSLRSSGAWPTSTSRCCAPTTATGTGSTASTTTPPITS